MSWEVGKVYKLESLRGNTTIVERLQELGFLSGESVKILYKTPFGEPYVVQVRDTSVALRKQELECLVLKS